MFASAFIWLRDEVELACRVKDVFFSKFVRAFVSVRPVIDGQAIASPPSTTVAPLGFVLSCTPTRTKDQASYFEMSDQ
jgi:hypothetical protein